MLETATVNTFVSRKTAVSPQIRCAGSCQAHLQLCEARRCYGRQRNSIHICISTTRAHTFSWHRCLLQKRHLAFRNLQAAASSCGWIECVVGWQSPLLADGNLGGVQHKASREQVSEWNRNSFVTPSLPSLFTNPSSTIEVNSSPLSAHYGGVRRERTCLLTCCIQADLKDRLLIPHELDACRTSA